MTQPLAPCGTCAAYKRHTRNGETPCEPCTAANRESSNRYRRQKAADRPQLQPDPTLIARRWQDNAACKDDDPDDWTPDTPGNPRSNTYRDTKTRVHTTCMACPVLESCAHHAATTYAQGWWAGAWLSGGNNGQRNRRELWRTVQQWKQHREMEAA